MVRLGLGAVNWISSSTIPSGPTAALGPVRSMLADWPSQVGWKLGVVSSRRDSRRSATGTNRRLLECFTVPAPGCARVPASQAGLRRRHGRQVKKHVVKVLCNTQRRTASECHLVRPLAEPDGGLGAPRCHARIFVSMERPGPEDSQGHAHEALTASARGHRWGTNPSRACRGGSGRSCSQGVGPSGTGSCRGGRSHGRRSGGESGPGRQ